MNSVEKSERTLVGRVVSNKRQATCKVEVSWSRRHPTYGKVIRGRTMLHVDVPQHDPIKSKIVEVGDLVEIKQVSPISKTKNWQLVQILEKE